MVISNGAALTKAVAAHLINCLHSLMLAQAACRLASKEIFVRLRDSPMSQLLDFI